MKGNRNAPFKYQDPEPRADRVARRPALWKSGKALDLRFEARNIAQGDAASGAVQNIKVDGFKIGNSFRREGNATTHLPAFTQLACKARRRSKASSTGMTRPGSASTAS